MISYYSAVFVTSLLLLGLLQYVVRKGSGHQKTLAFKVVGLTTAIAFLLPTLLNTLTLLQTGLLMAVLAALGGALVPVAELLPSKTRVFENEGVKVKETLRTEEEAPVLRKEDVSEEKPSEMEIIVEMDQGIPEEEVPVVEMEDPSPDPPVEETNEVEEAPQGLVLPNAFSETMAEVMLMNGYLALKDDEEEEAVDSFKMVCQRAQVIDQRMMAYMELKRLLPEIGRIEEVIQLGDELLAGKASLTTLQAGYIEKHTHALKRLVSLLNAHGVTLEQPYSEMPDELKEMAMTYQE